MSATGYIQVRAYTSTARFPLENVAIAVTATDGTALAMRLTDRKQIEAENLQVFADTTTNQNLEMIPLSEFPNQWDQTEIFNTPPQNL